MGAVVDFCELEEGKRSRPQRWLEAAAQLIGTPACAGACLGVVLWWAGLDFVQMLLGQVEFDPPPFYWLQGLIGLSALLIGIIVLSKQNRLAKLAEQRAHLDMTLMLLTEQKVAKLIELLEELRRDMPNVSNRTDSAANELQKPMNPDLVLAALEELAVPPDSS